MNASLQAFFWAAATIGIYAGARTAYRARPRWWTSPLLLTWTLCGLLILTLHASYHDYLKGTHWMIMLLGPATIAFAVPIHRQRALIRRHWRILVLGVGAGCALALGSSWLLAGMFDLSPELRASLLPRSVTTPLAMTTSSRLGGLPEITAVFTGLTGLFGAAIGDTLLNRLPFRSVFARGALFGMGAHGAGVAKARELGEEEGVVASLVMIFAGLVNVLVAMAVTAFR